MGVMNIWNVGKILSLLVLVIFLVQPAQAEQICYIKYGIEDGSLSVRAAPNSEAEEVALLLEWTPVKCERNKEWSVIHGKDKNGKPKDFYFYDNTNFFEPVGFKPQVRADPPLNINANKANQVSVFNEPGHSYVTCAMDPYNEETKTGCKPVSWPDENSKIDVLDSRIEWNRDSDRYEVFYQVRSQYDRTAIDPVSGAERVFTNDSIGWVRATDLKFGEGPKTLIPGLVTEVKPRFDKAPPPLPITTKPPDPVTGEVCPPELKDRLKIQTVANAALEQQIDSTFKALNSTLGECLLTPAGPPTTRVVGSGKNRKVLKIEPKMNMPKSNGYTYPFDNYMMAGYWNKLPNKGRTYDLPNEEAKPFGLDKMIAVDSLARTIYAEMSTCSDKPDWDKYLQAVARISLNRANAVRSTDRQVRTEAAGRFMRSDKDEKFLDLKHDITRVIAEPYSYSVWNPTTDTDPSHLKQLLCPPAKRNKRMWNGQDMTTMDPADIQERAIWEHALRYATEAVLFPTALQLRTQGLEANFYTSNLKMKGGELIRSPSMDGFRDFNRYCIQMWKEKGTKL